MTPLGRQLIDDEKRLRDNLGAVGRDTALYKQTLDKLGDTDATITTLSTAISKAAAEVEAAKEARSAKAFNSNRHGVTCRCRMASQAGFRR